MQTDTLIVGGGLSGLALAAKLQKASQSFLVVEAAERLGGRGFRLRSCVVLARSAASCTIH